jgi:hypothetical protein
MPARHISHQSFDDILSELGDDPAIPDPQGIRKPPAPQKTPHGNSSQLKPAGFQLKWLDLDQAKSSLLLLIQSGIFLCLFGVIFVGFDAHKNEADSEIKGLQEQLSDLKKEFSSHQEHWVQELDDLYKTIDEIEVSIHSNSKKSVISSNQSRLIASPYEADLRRWRYLGLTRTKGIDQAFFQTGKGTMMVTKEGVLLGDWRLVHLQKEMATAVHPLGKSIHFKSIRPE